MISFSFLFVMVRRPWFYIKCLYCELILLNHSIYADSKPESKITVNYKVMVIYCINCLNVMRSIYELNDANSVYIQCV